MRAIIAILVCASVACSASVRRPLTATDAATHLEQVTFSRDNEFNPAISPDASLIAYEVSPAFGDKPHIETRSLLARDHLYTSADVEGFEPTWTPDGLRLVFASKTHRSSRGLVETSGRDSAAYLSDDSDLPAHWPAISPDGRTIAMSVDAISIFKTGWKQTETFDHALVLTDFNGVDTHVVGEGTQPSFTPDGTAMVFVRMANGHAHLFVADARGANARQITEGASDDEAPAFSPDGTRIVFCSVDAAGTSANLFVVDRNGSGLVQLTEGDGTACRPAWGRDGFIYFHADPRTHFHIWRIAPRM